MNDCTVDTDLELLIPDSYVENIGERLSLYTQLDHCESEEELQQFSDNLCDRFGPLPWQVIDLFTALKARWLAEELGFEKIVLKNKQLRLYFVNNPASPYFESETFKKLLHFIQWQMKNARLKHIGTTTFLLTDGIQGIDSLYQLLKRMKESEEPGAGT